MQKALVRLGQRINRKLQIVEEIEAGNNNRLFQLKDDDDTHYLLKRYRRDGRQRLEREYGALEFLREKGFTNVPQAFAMDEETYAGLYSFEKGKVVPAEELPDSSINQIVEFICQIQKFTPEEVGVKLPSAVLACFSLKDYVNNVHHRLEGFMQYESIQDINSKIKELMVEYPMRSLFDSLILKTLLGIPEEQINRTIPESERRLGMIDFGPQNILVDSSLKMCFIDFEYFGWDDPMRIVGEFLVHPGTGRMNREKKQKFVSLYLDKMGLGEEELKRMILIEKLMAIDWLAKYLWSITPERLEIRRFANQNFREDEYLSKQIVKFVNWEKVVQEMLVN